MTVVLYLGYVFSIFFSCRTSTCYIHVFGSFYGCTSQQIDKRWSDEDVTYTMQSELYFGCSYKTFTVFVWVFLHSAWIIFRIIMFNLNYFISLQFKVQKIDPSSSQTSSTRRCEGLEPMTPVLLGLLYLDQRYSAVNQVLITRYKI